MTATEQSLRRMAASVVLLLAVLVAPAHAQMEQALEAHGGLETWRQYGILEYDLERHLGSSRGGDHQLIDLHTRRVRITSDAYTIGFDGEAAWITPDKEALTYGASPRFYSGTYFYFFAVPFVFADPGARQEALGRQMIDGQPYEAVRISYAAGTGDSPDDIYIAYLDPQTHRLALIRFSVTYGGRAAQEEPGTALVYEEWQPAGGLLVPQQASYYRWQDGAPGEKVGTITYRNVQFKRASPDAALFEKPEDAVIDALPEAGN